VLKVTEENTNWLRSLGHSQRMLGNGLPQIIIQFEPEVIRRKEGHKERCG